MNDRQEQRNLEELRAAIATVDRGEAALFARSMAAAAETLPRITP